MAAFVLDGLNAVSNAIGYAEHRSRSHHAVIRVYDANGNVIETHEHKGDFKDWLEVLTFASAKAAPKFVLITQLQFFSQETKTKNQMMKGQSTMTALAAALALSALHFTAAAPTSTTDDINPEDFTTTIDNPFLPLQPSTTFIYKGNKEGSKQRDVFAVTDRTIVIDGVTCRVVHDRVFMGGVLQEDTFDYFAQDLDGNVWYFGEDTEELDRKGRVVSTAGTWRAGVDGAQPGVIMEAHPKVGDHYFQEVAAPIAQDEATVLNLHEIVAVPLGNFTNCLQTREFTQLEPGNVEHKFYARGVGFILGVVVKGGKERLALVNIVREP